MLSPKVCYIFRTGKPTNFKLGTHMEHEDPYCPQAPWPRSRSRCHVVRLTGWERKSHKHKNRETVQKMLPRSGTYRVRDTACFCIMGKGCRPYFTLVKSFHLLWHTGRRVSSTICGQWQRSLLLYTNDFNYLPWKWSAKSSVVFLVVICQRQLPSLWLHLPAFLLW